VLSHLVDKSLVVAREADGEARYRTLETVRQYGREKLDESGDEAEVGRRHVGFYVELAEEAERELSGAGSGTVAGPVGDRARQPQGGALPVAREGGDAALGVRLAAALWPFWFARGT
jgi:non-specific serine/threonine protein kinase